MNNNKKSSLDALLHKSDLFSSPLLHKFESESFLTTKCGGVCSLVIYAIMIFVFLYNTISVATKANYEVK